LRSAAHLHQLNLRIHDVLAHHVDGPGGADIAEALVDAVYAAQKRALAAAGGSDHRGDDALANAEIDVEERLERAVPEIQLLRADGQAALLARLHVAG
jgi:hypothetical protein